MSSSPESSRWPAPFLWLGRGVGLLWWFIDTSRKIVFNLIFLLVLALLLGALALGRSSPAPLSEKTTLVLKLQGPLVEQQAAHAPSVALAQLSGKEGQATQLRDVLAALDAATLDPKIHNAVLLLDDFQGAGLPALREVAAALQRFKAAGKTVVAWGHGYEQRQYFLAAHANEVWMHPMGIVFLQGMGGYRNYYREAFDRLGITVNLLRVGAYKNAGEVYVAEQPSAESQEASALLYSGLWASYTRSVEAARKLPSGTLMALIDALPERLAQTQGDAAQLALQAKLVDHLLTRDELRQRLIARGAATRDGKTFRQIQVADYLARHAAPRHTPAAVGVVVAEGTIVDGPAPAGTVGGTSTAELVRQARLDPDIRAVVLRVNSPGGSPLGSELVRRELALTRQAGKPVVVSMGDVAASGGYWISLAADEVLADEATITGSIGIFALLPRVDKALDHLGVRTGGVATTWLAGVADPRRPLDPRFADLLQSHLNHVYADFTGKTAQARKTTPQAIDAVAQGRVWTGQQAHERGLVDRLGGLREAVASAAQRARLKAPAVRYIEPDRSRMERLIGWLSASAAASAQSASLWHSDSDAQNADALIDRAIHGPLHSTPFADAVAATVPGGPPATAWARAVAATGSHPQAAQAQRELGLLLQSTQGNQPFATLAHCLCGVE